MLPGRALSNGGVVNDSGSLTAIQAPCSLYASSSGVCPWISNARQSLWVVTSVLVVGAGGGSIFVGFEGRILLDVFLLSVSAAAVGPPPNVISAQKFYYMFMMERFMRGSHVDELIVAVQFHVRDKGSENLSCRCFYSKISQSHW